MGRLSFETPQVDLISGVMPISDHKQSAIGIARIAWRHRWAAMAIFALSMCAAIALLIVLPPTYTARATIQIEVAREPAKVSSIFGDSPSSASTSLESSTIVQSEAAIMKSPLIVRRAVERLGLADVADISHPGPVRRVINGFTRLFRDIREKINPGLQAGTDDHEDRVSDLTELIIRHTSIETDSRSYLVNIVVSSGSAAQSIAIANTIADEYLKLRSSINSDTATKTVDWLSNVIAETTRALRAAEKDVADYRIRHDVVGEGTQQDNSSHQQLVNLENELNAAALDRINQEERLAQLQDAVKQGVLVSAANLQGVPSVQTLVQREAAARVDLAEALFKFQPSNPHVQKAQAALAEITALLNDEVRRTVAVMKAGVAMASRRETDIKHRMDALQGQASNRAEVEDEFRRLTAREQTIREQLLSLDRNKYHAAAVRDLQSVPASLIMPAERMPDSAALRVAVTLIAAAVAGLVGGIMAALLLERGNTGFRSSVELPLVSNVRCLGMIPELPRPARGGKPDPARVATCTEAVRSVGAELGLFGAPRGCRVILITSSMPNEGAATLSGALAEVLRAAGKRVMLIGGFLTEADAQDIATFSKIISADSGQRDVARLGLDRRNYSDLDVFKNERLLDVLDSARADFDVVILEGPPVNLAADSLVLGQIVDTVVHVIRWGTTERHAVLTALQRLKDSSIDVTGLVLMDVDLGRHARLGFVDECFYYKDQQPPYRQVSAQAATGFSLERSDAA